MKKEPTYIIFGAEGHPNKGVVNIQWDALPGYGVAICELKNGEKYDYGLQEEPIQDDISGVYSVMWFCKKESLDSVIAALTKLRGYFDD